MKKHNIKLTVKGHLFNFSLGTKAEVKQEMSFEEQIETLKKLKELVNMGILSEDEFNIKKKEIMGL